MKGTDISFSKKCLICGNDTNNHVYNVNERMINKGDSFHYLYCSQCKTLQLIDIIENVSDYYLSDYGPFNIHAMTRNVPKKLAALYIYIISRISLTESVKLLYRRFSKSGVSNLYKTKINQKTRILDVAAGNGTFAKQLKDLGIDDVKCIDKYCLVPSYKDINFTNGEIFDVEGKYDLITFNHSFEHMSEPIKVLTKVKELLSEEGLCLIRIPVSNSTAWNMYHENWYQIDAPRHFFLYSPDAMTKLCEKAGLYVEKVRYDSNPDQFYISEAYQKTNKSLYEIKNSSNILLSLKYAPKAFRSNRKGTGDQACFYIRRKTHER